MRCSFCGLGERAHIGGGAVAQCAEGPHQVQARRLFGLRHRVTALLEAWLMLHGALLAPATVGAPPSAAAIALTVAICHRRSSVAVSTLLA